MTSTDALPAQACKEHAGGCEPELLSVTIAEFMLLISPWKGPEHALPQVPKPAQHLPMLAQDLGARKCGQCMIGACQDCPMAPHAQLAGVPKGDPDRMSRAGEALLHRRCMLSALCLLPEPVTALLDWCHRGRATILELCLNSIC